MIARGWRIAACQGSAMMALVCAVGASLAPGSASAQPAAAPVGVQVNADAQQLFADGQTAAKLTQWDKARTLFQAAWRVQQHWKIAVSLGRAELKVGRMRDAAEHLAFFLREVPAGMLAPADRKQVEEMLAQARAKVGTVRVTGAPEGAEVMVDGVVMGKAPLHGELFVEPGPHRVEARRHGYVDGEAALAAVGGKEAAVELRMVKMPEAKPVAALGPVAGGVVAVPPAVGPNKGVVIAGAALTAVGIGLGIGFTAAGTIKGSQFEMLAPSACKGGKKGDVYGGCPDELIAIDASRMQFTNMAGASFLAAGLLGAGTLTYALLGGSSKSKNRPTAAAVVLPGVVGGTVTIPW